jgi:hypothetical protein
VETSFLEHAEYFSAAVLGVNEAGDGYGKFVRCGHRISKDIEESGQGIRAQTTGV